MLLLKQNSEPSNLSCVLKISQEKKKNNNLFLKLFLQLVNDHVHFHVKKFCEQTEWERIEQHIYQQHFASTPDDLQC